MEAWEKITSNQWILQVVSGYKLEFIAQPHQSHRPVSVETGRQAQLVSGEIGKLLEKGAIQEVRGDTQEGFFSRVFLVPKKDGQVRPVLNLRPLNQFLSHSHFKMEGMHVVRDLLQKNDWMTRIDLKDAYFSVPIHPQHRKFLRFRWQEKCFQFTCLPFGLASAPRVFTKILRPIVGFLRSRGIRCVIYLDDLLLLHQNRDTLKEHTATALALLEALGFLVNYPKSMLDPSQIMVFLGFTINSIRKELSLPTEKVGKIVAEVKVMLDCHTVSARSLAQLIGKMTAALLAVHPAPLHYRSLQHLKHVALRRKGYDGQVTISPRSSQGPAVVGRESVYMEWESNPGPQPQHGNRDRCLKKGMGSLLSRCPDRRLLECAGGEVAHKLLGNAGSILCNQSLCEGEAASFDSAAYRQHVSSGPCQSDGRNKVPITCVSSDRSLVVVPTEAHHHYSAAHSRAGECHSRLLVKTPEGQDGLGVGAQHFQMCEPSSWSPSGRSFCNSVFKAASSFLQLEARPRGRGYRCLCTELVQIPGFCAPSVVPDFTGSSESPFRPSISGADHSSLVHTGVVLYLDGVTSGLSHPTSPGSRCDSSISQLRLPNSGGTSPVGRLEGLRQRFREKKISDQAVDLILSSWRDKTNANYNSAWKAWESWCSARGIYPFASDISYVLDFLADKYTAGLKYRSLNCYQSALSSVLLPVEGFQVGQHPLVARLLRGVFNCRPPQPRYSQTWEVSQVLSYIKSLGPNEELSLKLISRKLVVLLALVLAHRCSDLGRLTLQGRKYSTEGAVLRCTGLAKQARPGKEESLRPAVISHFLEDALLCQVLCLKAYERATASFRKKDSMQLFLAINSPHQPVTTSTVARWLKQAIVVSGIEPEFTAHSTRGASSTAAAMNGITIREVMERAGWSRQDTFCKHYFRPTEQALVAAEYGRSILEQSTNMHRTC